MNKGKVYVGISGGVDSSVALYLLKQSGYDVTGVYLRTWQPDWMECTWRDERRDAMRVCAHLDVPFLEHDVSDLYRQKVSEYMINEYKLGRTPNPDVMCNQEIKFGEFFNWAMGQGAEYVATGHYACSEDSRLKKGEDDTKDQTYFLWTLSEEILTKTLFPLGRLRKTEVRNIAKRAGIPTAQKKDSQGICFIGDIGMKEFLSHYIPREKGDVLNIDGEVIGFHDGALFFTLGERHGFTISKKTPGDPILYVVSKNLEKNTITVSPRMGQGKNSVGQVRLKDAIFRETLDPKKIYSVEIRYHGIPILSATEILSGDEVVINFLATGIVVAPGQSVVLYDRDVCIGGGVVI